MTHTTMNATDVMLKELSGLAAELQTLMSRESEALRGAKFLQATDIQSRKITLHERVSVLLEALRLAPKSPEQKDMLRSILTSLRDEAQSNMKALDLGFGALTRLINRIMSAVRRAADDAKTPRYTARGGYHVNGRKSVVLHADRMA